MRVFDAPALTWKHLSSTDWMAARWTRIRRGALGRQVLLVPWHAVRRTARGLAAPVLLEPDAPGAAPTTVPACAVRRPSHDEALSLVRAAFRDDGSADALRSLLPPTLLRPTARA